MRGYSPSLDTVLTLSARVTGNETVTLRDGARVDTWVVSMDFGRLPSTLWIAQTSRALVRQTIEIGPQLAMLMER